MNDSELNREEKGKKFIELSTELPIFFCLFLILLIILSILDPLQWQLLCGFQEVKKDFFRVKKDFFRVKKDFFRVKKDLLCRVF